MKTHEVIEGVLASAGVAAIVGGIAVGTVKAIQKHKNNKSAEPAEAKTESENSENNIEENKEEK